MSDTPAQRRLASEIAAFRLIRALRSEAELKANFNPSQPRNPQGSGRESGRWSGPAGAIAAAGGAIGSAAGGLRTAVRAGAFGKPLQQVEVAIEATARPLGRAAKTVGDAVGRAAEQTVGPISRAAEQQFDAAVAAAPPPVREFIQRNRVKIRTAGLLQAAGGVGEGGLGAAALVGGLATAPEGGLLATGAGAWMVARGYDDLDTGLKTLISGEPHESGFTATLKGFGFTDREAEGISILTAGVTPSAALRMGRRGLDDAIERALLKDALQPFGPGLKLTRDGSFWREVDIMKRGVAWEDVDLKITGFKRLPAGFKTFDQVSQDGRVAVSNKTLDIERDFYKDTAHKRVQARMKQMIDDVAGWKRGTSPRTELPQGPPSERRLHLLLPSGRAVPGQTMQMAAAASYAKSRGVFLSISFGR